MKTNEAISKRIEEICKEKGKNVCKACLSGGKSPSALYDLIKMSEGFDDKELLRGSGHHLVRIF